jgi:hypothetical protein
LEGDGVSRPLEDLGRQMAGVAPADYWGIKVQGSGDLGSSLFLSHFSGLESKEEERGERA